MPKKRSYKNILMLGLLLILVFSIFFLGYSISQTQDPLVLLNSMASEAQNNVNTLVNGTNNDTSILLTPVPTYTNKAVTVTPTTTRTVLTPQPTAKAQIMTPTSTYNNTSATVTPTVKVEEVVSETKQELPKAGVLNIIPLIFFGAFTLLALAFVL